MTFTCSLEWVIKNMEVPYLPQTAGSAWLSPHLDGAWGVCLPANNRATKSQRQITSLPPHSHWAHFTHLRVGAAVGLRLVDKGRLDIVQVPPGGHVPLLLLLPFVFERDQLIVRSQVVSVSAQLRHVWMLAAEANGCGWVRPTLHFEKKKKTIPTAGKPHGKCSAQRNCVTKCPRFVFTRSWASFVCYDGEQTSKTAYKLANKLASYLQRSRTLLASNS